MKQGRAGPELPPSGSSRLVPFLGTVVLTMIMGFRLLLGALALTEIATQFAWGHEGIGPDEFVVGFNRLVSAEMGAPGLSDSEKKARFGALVDKGLDLDAVGKHLLGWRWAQASAETRRRFDREFRAYLIQAFALRTTGMRSGRMAMLGVRQEDDSLVVLTLVDTEEAAQVPFAWRLVRSGSGWRLRDIVIKDISMAAVMQSQFDALLQSSAADIEPLLRLLHEKSLG